MKNDIKQSLARAAGQLPKADLDALKAAEVTPMDKHDYITRQTDAKPRRPMRRIAVLAACLLVVIAGFTTGGWYWQNRMVDTIIDIDVNPSYDIMVNRKDKVIEIRPMNAAAQEVLDGRQYAGWDLEDAIFTLFSDLPNHGYLQSEKSTVLVSVSGKNEQRSANLGNTVSETIALALLGTKTSPNVVTQVFSADNDLLDNANRYGISSGKMRIVGVLLEIGAPFSEEELATMPVEELIALAHEYGLEGLADHYYPSYSNKEYATPYTEPPISAPDSSKAPVASQPLPPASQGLPPAENTPDIPAPAPVTSAAPPPASTPPPPANSTAPPPSPPSSSAPVPAASTLPADDSPYEDTPYQEPAPAPAPTPESAPASTPTGDSPYDDSPYLEDSPYAEPGNDSAYSSGESP